MAVEFARFDPSTATDADYAAIADLRGRIHAVDRPEIPAISLATTIEMMSTSLDPVSISEREWWTARDGDEYIGVALLRFPIEENTDQAWLFPELAADRRRQGIGSDLLRALLPTLKAKGRPRVLAPNVFGGTGGEGYAEAAGAKCTYRSMLQELTVPTTDPALWDVPSPAGYRLEHWLGAAPEALIDSYARARTAIADAPSQDFELEETDWTPERIRTDEARYREAGHEQRVAVAVHEATGGVAAFTELFRWPSDPAQGRQDETAVSPEHRGHGLGRAIKARNMRELLASAPEVTRVTTTTASTNVWMAAVNRSLGYRDGVVMAYYEIQLDALAAWLGR